MSWTFESFFQRTSSSGSDDTGNTLKDIAACLKVNFRRGRSEPKKVNSKHKNQERYGVMVF